MNGLLGSNIGDAWDGVRIWSRLEKEGDDLVLTPLGLANPGEAALWRTRGHHMSSTSIDGHLHMLNPRQLCLYPSTQTSRP